MTDGTEVVRSDDQLMVAARAAGWDKLSAGQRDFAMALAQRYGLDPLMRHLVMIEGSPYITRDGLLHVAHRSGDFDGIEVTDPVLDEKADGRGRRFWRARAKVYRRTFSRPFDYPGRYPDNGRNAAYAEEMCIKVAEVMTLRRAYDVSAPTVEERWSETDEFPTGPGAQPLSLAERVAERAAAIEAAQDESGEPEYPDALNVNHYGDETSPPRSDEAAAVAEADAIVGAALQGIVEGIDELAQEDEPIRLAPNGETVDERPVVAPGQIGMLEDLPEEPAEELEELEEDKAEPEPAPPAQDEPVAFRLPAAEPTSPEAAAWAVWATPRREKVKAAVKAAYPDVRRLSELTPDQRALIKGAVDAEETEQVKAVQAEREVAAPPRPARPAKAEPRPAAGPDARCDAVSPLSGDACTLVPGHLGVHRHGQSESW